MPANPPSPPSAKQKLPQTQPGLQCASLPRVVVFQKIVLLLRNWLMHWIGSSHWIAFLCAKRGHKAMTVLKIKLGTYTSKCLLALCVLTARSCGLVPPAATAHSFFRFLLGCLRQ